MRARQAGAGRGAVEPAGRDDDGVARSPCRRPARAPASWTMLTPAIAGFSGCAHGSCSRAAARIRSPASERSRASCGSIAKPSARRRRSRTTCRRRRRRRAIVPSPSTSSGASSRSAKQGTFVNSTLSQRAVAARRPRLDDAAGRFEPHDRLGLAHLDHAGLEQDGRRADRVRAGHGRVLGRLHDDEAGVAVRAASQGRRGSRGTATLPRGSRSSSFRSRRRRAASVCICSNTVAPAGGRTPPTTTLPISPPAWQPTTVIIRRERMTRIYSSSSSSSFVTVFQLRAVETTPRCLSSRSFASGERWTPSGCHA